MDLFKRKGKQNIKIRFRINFLKLEKVPKTTAKVFLSWKRGNKKENEGKTALFPYEKNITLNQELNMTCSIIKEKDKYESKYLSVSLREEKAKKSSSKVIIDLADYVDTTKTEQKELTMKKGPTLIMTISAEWLQIDNKKVVSSGSGSGEKVSVNGQEFDLVTTDDVSEGSDDDGDDPFAESEAEDDSDREEKDRFKKGDSKRSLKREPSVRDRSSSRSESDLKSEKSEKDKSDKSEQEEKSEKSSKHERRKSLVKSHSEDKIPEDSPIKADSESKFKRRESSGVSSSEEDSFKQIRSLTEELSKTKKENEELQTQIKRSPSTEDVSKLKKEVEELNTKGQAVIKEMDTKIASLEKELQQSKVETEKLKKDLESSKASGGEAEKKLKEEVDKLNKEIAQKTKEASAAKDAEAQSTKNAEELARAKADITELKAQLETAKASTDAEAKKASTMEEAGKKLQADLQLAKEEIGKLKSDLATAEKSAAAKDEIEVLREQLQDMISQLDASQAATKDAEAAAEQSASQVSSLTGQMEDAEHARDTALRQVTDLESEVSRMKQELAEKDKLISQVEELERQKGIMHDELQEAIHSLATTSQAESVKSAKHSKLADELAAAQAKIEVQASAIQSLEKREDELSSAVEEQEKLVKKHEEASQDLNSKLKTCEKQLKESDRKLKQAQEASAELEEKLDAARKNNSELDGTSAAQIQDIEKRLKESKVRLSEKESIIDDLKQQVMAAEESNKDLEEKLKSAIASAAEQSTSAADESASRVKELEKKLKDAKNKLIAHEERVVELEDKLADNDERLKSLQVQSKSPRSDDDSEKDEKIQTLEEELQLAKDKLEEAQKQSRELEDQLDEHYETAEELQNLKKEHEELKKKSSEKESEWKSKVSKLRTDLEKARAAKKAKHDESSDDESSTDDRVQALEDKIDDLQEELQSKENEIKNLKDEYEDDLKSQSDRFEKMKKKWKKDMEAREDEMADMQNQIEILQEKSAELEKELLIARGGKPLPTKEEDAIVAVSKKQLERERRRLKERDEEISKLRKEAIEMKEQKTQYMQAQAGGAPVPSRRSIDYTATELAGLQDLRSKLELLETQLSAKNKQIEQLEKDAGSDRIDNATAKKEVSQVRVVQQQLEDVKKALEEERLAAQRLAKKEKDYIEEIKNLKTKRPTADDGLDEATLRKRKEEFELLFSTVYGVVEWKEVSPRLEPPLQRLVDTMLKNKLFDQNNYNPFENILAALEKQALAALNSADYLTGWLNQITVMRDVLVNEFFAGEPTSKVQGIVALYESQNPHKHSSMLQEESDTESDSDSDDSDEEDARRKRRGKNQNIPATRRFVNDLASIQLGVFQAMLRLAHSKIQPNIKLGIMDQKAANIKKITNVLSNFMKPQIRFKLVAPIIEQFFSQLFYFVDATVFNSLIEDGSPYCSASHAFNIKLSLSHTEQWGHSNFGASFERIKETSMRFIFEATNLLVMDKTPVIFSTEMRTQAWPSLTPSQVLALFKNYKPDNISPAPISEDVKKGLRNMSSRDDRLRLDETLLIPPTNRR